jgi:hypothetical protein
VKRFGTSSAAKSPTPSPPPIQWSRSGTAAGGGVDTVPTLGGPQRRHRRHCRGRGCRPGAPCPGPSMPVRSGRSQALARAGARVGRRLSLRASPGSGDAHFGSASAHARPASSHHFGCYNIIFVFPRVGLKPSALLRHGELSPANRLGRQKAAKHLILKKLEQESASGSRLLKESSANCSVPHPQAVESQPASAPPEHSRTACRGRVPASRRAVVRPLQLRQATGRIQTRRRLRPRVRPFRRNGASSMLRPF